MNTQVLSRNIKKAEAANARKKYSEAAKWCHKTLKLAPDLPEAWYNLGIALAGLGQCNKAINALDKARAATVDSADAQNSIGLQFIEMDAYSNAEQCLKQAINLAPGYAYAHSNLGILYERQQRLADAESSFKRAIELQPELAPAYLNLGAVLKTKNDHEGAIAAYAKALDIDPGLTGAWRNYGNLLFHLKRYEKAAYCYGKMLELEDDSYILMAQLYSRMMICDWDAFESALSEIVDKTRQGNAAFSPFPLLPLTDSPDLQLRAAETYAADKYPEQSELGPIPERTSHERIRIGYYSADYRNHATTYLIAELFEAHDKEKFELIGFSYGPDQKDEMRERVVAAFDRFIDIRDMSDIEVAELSRELEIDIAVDLKGYTEDARSGIFSYRAAPFQVSYLGYPGTMGASYIDYIIADSTVITAESQPYFSESVVYLPGSYQVNDSKRKISERLFTREELGLPDDGFVFCCFNKNYKITPRTFDSWMRILGKVNNSVLWLFEKNDVASANLRKQAERQGIDPGRLIFVSFLPLDEHLARHRAADLFIDTFPYNAHTTASDALWSGLPVLTCAGESFASRVGASLLNAIEMPELITSTHEEYEALAVELASNPEKLEKVRNKLQDNRMTTPLFDAQLFTQNLEKAYRAMYEKYQTGQPASHMYIE